MSRNNTFIIVRDKTTAEKMIVAGFILISSDEFKYIFINDNHVKFNFENANVCYSDILTF